MYDVVDRVLACDAAVLVTRGTGWRRTRDAVLPVVAPAVFWLRSGRPHSYGPDSGGWQEHWLLFQGPDVDAYRTLGQLRDGTLAEPQPLVRLIDDTIAACVQDDPGSHVRASVLTHQFIASAVTARSSTALRELAASAFDGDVTVSAVARKLGLTDAALRADVRARTGTTPGEYVIGLRLTRAKTLLAETAWPVAQVAAAVGYSDAAYFSRLFSQRTGRTPRRFRAEILMRAHRDPRARNSPSSGV